MDHRAPRRANEVRSLFRAAIVLLAALLVTPCVVSAKRPTPTVGVSTSEKLRTVVGNLKTRLQISVPVVVSVVPKNALMMSVEAPAKHDDPFRLEIDATFLATLTPEEIEAAIAHELGHVWVYTHHPYLHTEKLANEIALRVVARGALERVYGKVWTHGDARNDLTRVLGPEPKAALGLAAEAPER